MRKLVSGGHRILIVLDIQNTVEIARLLHNFYHAGIGHSLEVITEQTDQCSHWQPVP
jgi:hypothetical protein